MKSIESKAFIRLISSFLLALIGLVFVLTLSHKAMALSQNAMMATITQTAEANTINNLVKSDSSDLKSATTITNDPKAKAKLREILAKFDQLQANFSQKISDMQGEVLQTSSGQILLKKPQQLRWTVSFPEESILIADGNTVYNIDPFVEQVTLIEQAELTQNNPLMLLVSDQESQWQNVNIQKFEGGFILQSVDIDASISKVILSFDAQQKLSSLKSLDKQQQQNEILFTDVVVNLPISDDQFTFETPENWVLDDQRTIN